MIQIAQRATGRRTSVACLFVSVWVCVVSTFAQAGERPLTPAPFDTKAAAMVPAAIRAKGFITFGTVGTSSPGAFVAADGKTLIGFEIDLLRALGQVLGLDVRFERVRFDGLIPGVLSGRYQGANSTFTVTEARLKVVDMITYGQAGLVIIVPKDSTMDFSSYRVLCGHSVATVQGSADQQLLTEEDALCGKRGQPSIDIRVFPDQDTAALATASHRTEAYATNVLEAGYRVDGSHGALKMSTAFNLLPSGFAVGKDSGLTSALFEATTKLMKSPSYQEIFVKWGITSAELKEPELNMTRLARP